MSRHGLDGRLAALEARGDVLPSYVVVVPDGADDAAVAAAVAAHRTRTGYRGAVIVAPDESQNVDAWVACYAAGRGAA